MPDAPPLVTSALVAQLQTAYAAHLTAGWQSVQAADGNPFDIDIRRFGEAIACRSKALAGVPQYNRAMGLGRERDATLDELLAFFREAGVQCQVDVEPGVLTDTVAARLADRGLYHASFQTLLYGLPRTSLMAPARVSASEVGAADMDRFLDLWAEGYGYPADWRTESKPLWRHWFAMPGYRLYIASYDGLPASIGGLAIHDGIGLLQAAATLQEYRGRGCQAALLQRRIIDAAAAGCELVASQVAFGTGAQRNLERAGLRIACTKAIWRDGVAVG